MKKVIALLLAAILLLSLAACGSASSSISVSASGADSSSADETVSAAVEPVQDEVAEAEADSTEEDTAGEKEEIEEIAVPPVILPLTEETEEFSIWYVMSPLLGNYIDTPETLSFYKELEARTNVHLNFTTIGFAAQEEQASLMVASGDYTDLTTAPSTGVDSLAQAVEIDYLLALNDYLDCLPNYLNTLKTLGYEKHAVLDDGTYAMVYGIWEPDRPSFAEGFVTRGDWLDELGMESPQTYDELETMLAAMKGLNGSTIMVHYDGLDSHLLPGYGMSSLNNGFFVEEGTVQYGFMQDGFREYLEMLNRWYEEGYIHQDFMSKGELIDEALITDGTVCVFNALNINWDTVATAAADGGGYLTAVAYPVKDTSDHITFANKYITQGGIGVTTACENPELACRWIDYLYTEEGSLLANFGIEGEGFTYDENGQPHFTDKVKNDYPNFILGMSVYTYGDMGPFIINWQRSFDEYPAEFNACLDVWNPDTNTDDSILYSLSFTTDENDAIAGILSDVDTLFDENIMKIIVGDVPVSQLDSVVQQAESLGIQDCIDVYQAAYDRFLAR